MKRSRWIGLALAALALAGCAPVPPSNVRGPAFIGTLEVDGTAAYHNGRHAAGGERVFHGDTISTGPNTSLRLRFAEGGYLQLDENTDPKLLREGACILIEILKGQALVDAKRICIETPDVSFVLNSRANIVVSPGVTDIVMLEGSATMRRPVPATLYPLDRYHAARGGAAQTRVTPQQAEAMTRWTERYFQRRYVPPPVAPPPAFTPPVVDTPPTVRTPPAPTPPPAPPLRQPPPPPPGPKQTPVKPAAPVLKPILISGWCCASGSLFQETRPACDKRKGQFYTDEKKARSVCQIIR